MKLILASNSPRRREILEKYGYVFEIIPSNEKEKTADNLTPQETAKYLATQKAINVFNSIKDNTDYAVLGADTVVCFNNKIIGKPKSEQDAKNTLKMLSGKIHTVITGYCMIKKNKIINGAVETKVIFNNLSEKTIKDYICSGLPMDKAGSYGIQDGFDLVKESVGSYYNVVGLPIDIIEKDLKEFLK